MTLKEHFILKRMWTHLVSDSIAYYPQWTPWALLSFHLGRFPNLTAEPQGYTHFIMGRSGARFRGQSKVENWKCALSVLTFGWHFFE